MLCYIIINNMLPSLSHAIDVAQEKALTPSSRAPLNFYCSS